MDYGDKMIQKLYIKYKWQQSVCTNRLFKIVSYLICATVMFVFIGQYFFIYSVYLYLIVKKNGAKHGVELKNTPQETSDTIHNVI